ncbi:uncharacterized protein A4U43_C02F10380 [Asparagus officinalis]|uniref:Uncharacterized protein n=1 Tax=Asparagus officinalis TaxID=4686 RepID=A0A5P1FJ87_ASPOF|nr:uncharacterized protein LOC109830561 [Asparagus officinalis]XP_020253446.1 uncharacterized protein LOC109830561 [Asparagus officinalis]XP_020253447.1 uncharacterized protein LOC109830561 [Asparagus officinalis]XP_020253448.1 uncharacterized protein LOC109830561 [Asparagus officinalis]XP_020253449.1 uncharacterized protein LOC109830561 [Asparagus officinalis]XP_020253450.1 uncharacterized protein LOC109830561 [Asparagus officinalis]ONK77773.1 uncharacterized protein A4U43_C02F10380 [Asparag
MAPAMFSHLQNVWPFSMLKKDDLKLSNQLVHKLSLPEHTKNFIFAIQDPDSHSIVYILAAQNLSKQSALDTEQLIKEVQPEAVVCLVASSILTEIQEEDESLPDDQVINVPTSSFGVLKKCLVDKINKEQYEASAKSQVLREIFGVGLYGHIFAAKKATDEIGSQFILLESPYERSAARSPSNVKTGYYISELKIPYIKSLLKKEMQPNYVSKEKQDESQPKCDYKAPPFALSIYALLADLHEIFNIIPSIKNALTSAQEMLSCINKGEPIATQILLEVHNFRIAIEALRVALNEASRCPLANNQKTSKLDFSQISSEEMSNAICAQALKSQARKFGSLVAIVDVGKLAGLRRHWTTTVPPEVACLTDQCFTHYLSGDEGTEAEPLAENPISFGARATSLLKVVPFYALVKLATFKLPVSVKFGIEHLQRTAGIANVGAKTCPVNFSGLFALAERTGLLGVQTSFYEIMRRRAVKFGPLAMFSCSMATCAGFMVYKDGIYCAAKSIHSVPMIVSMGRGLERLQQASEEVRQSGMKAQEKLQSVMYTLRKINIQ